MIRAIRTTSAALTAMLPTLLVAGCTTTAADKAGDAAAEPLVLTIGTDDRPGRVSAEQIEHFAARVSALSEGTLQITPRWSAAGAVPDWDQEVARMVERRELDLALIPSRAFDTEGVTSLSALNAPFLITSDALLADVIRGELSGDLLSGLGAAGVTGLSLFPGGLRHPFGVTEPLMGPEDYAGRSIRSPTSATVAALFEALGATTNDDEPFDAERSDGMESGYLESPDVAFATGNVTFFPKVLVLVVNTELLRELSPDHEAVLTTAATETQEWAIRTTPTDREAAEQWCRDGGTIAHATKGDLDALAVVADEVTRDLARDPLTARLIEEIARRKAAMPDEPSVGAECVGGRVPSPGTTDGEGIDGDFPAGVYRYEITRQDLVAAGVENESLLNDSVGIFTWTMNDGRYCFEHRGQFVRPEVCGRYEVDADTITVHLGAGVSATGRWAVEDDGDLVFTLIGLGPNPDPIVAAATARPWKRIGDVAES